MIPHDGVLVLFGFESMQRLSRCVGMRRCMDGGIGKSIGIVGTGMDTLKQIDRDRASKFLGHAAMRRSRGLPQLPGTARCKSSGLPIDGLLLSCSDYAAWLDC